MTIRKRFFVQEEHRTPKEAQQADQTALKGKTNNVDIQKFIYIVKESYE